MKADILGIEPGTSESVYMLITRTADHREDGGRFAKAIRVDGFLPEKEWETVPVAVAGLGGK